MKQLNFFDKYDEPVVIALGFFDCIHCGHSTLINSAKKVAEESSAELCVFTFKNDPSQLLSRDRGVIFTYEERLEKLAKLSVNKVIFTSFTKDFSLILPNVFLDFLIGNFNVKAIVCGKDYTFGRDGKGNLYTLEKYCQEKGILLHAEDEVLSDGKKISTRDIKRLLTDGEIEKANLLLGSPYFISGKVEQGRKVGRTLGFPTANVNIDAEKLKIKNGVYKTHLFIGGKKFNAITNYGARPTYGLDEVLTETYISGYDGNLYGELITVYFDEFLRDCVKFESEEQLKLQLKRDLEEIND